MNKTKRTLEIVSGVSAIILGLLLSVLMALVSLLINSCAEVGNSIGGNEGSGSGLEPTAKLLLTIFTLLPLIISLNGVLILKKKPDNKIYRIIINVTLIMMCIGVFIFGLFGDDEIYYVLLAGIIPAIPSAISLFIKEKPQLEEQKEG